MCERGRNSQEKKEEGGEIEEEEYHQMENEMIFCLEEDSKYCVSAIGKWYENTAGEVIGDVDTYFLHILTNQRCETVRDCFAGWSEPDERSTEKWEALCERIEEYENLEQDMCYEKTISV